MKREKGERISTLRNVSLGFLSFCLFVFLDQLKRFLGNCPPTPPLSRHFAQREK